MELTTTRSVSTALRRQAHTPATERPPSPCDVRSLFFVRPGGLERKLAGIEGRTLIVDLEDGVPPSDKPERRQFIQSRLREGLFSSRDLLVRVNGLDEGIETVEADLEASVRPGLHGLILPMIRTADHVRLFDALVMAAERANGVPPGQVAFYALLEQAEAVLNAIEIARASKRVRALCFGHADFLLSLSGDPGPPALSAALGEVVLAAGAAGVPAVASPFLDVKNMRGFANYCRRMRELGFAGVFTLNPRQDAMALRAFSVTALETMQAHAVLDKVTAAASIGVVSGQMVGPPMAAKARRALARSDVKSKPVEEPVVGEPRRYGVDLGRIRLRQVLTSPHEMTVDDSWRTAWLASFPTSNRLITSDPYARSWGLPGRALPPGMLLNLTLCMSVEPFSHSCRLHLGLHDAEQRAAAEAGDTFRNFIRVEAIRNTSRGDASVIRSTHVLVNQRDECVFRLTKMSYFDPVAESAIQVDEAADDGAGPWFETGASNPLTDALCASSAPALAASEPLAEGRVLLHPAVRPIGWSENLLLTTLFRNTHPVHFDAQRFTPEELIVCGGFVQSMAFALAESELRQVVAETLEHSSHVNTVAPEDRIGAVSRVLSVEPVSNHLERIRIKTLGLRNVDVERELGDLALPGRLFGEAALKPSAIEQICREERPELEGRIALQATRGLLRTRAADA